LGSYWVEKKFGVVYVDYFGVCLVEKGGNYGGWVQIHEVSIPVMDYPIEKGGVSMAENGK